METLAVRTLLPPPWPDIEPLIAESEAEGFRFLARLRREYLDGATRFGGVGETLLGVYAGAELVALGGLTRDPYDADPRVGRVRHVYVALAHRRNGAGRLLVSALVDAARGHFHRLTLRTDTEAAARFYSAIGFSAIDGGPTRTHVLDLDS